MAKARSLMNAYHEIDGHSGSDLSGEGRDRASLRLPGIREKLLKRLLETGKPVVVVLANGRPLSLEGTVDDCAAVVEA